MMPISIAVISIIVFISIYLCQDHLFPEIRDITLFLSKNI